MKQVSFSYSFAFLKFKNSLSRLYAIFFVTLESNVLKLQSHQPLSCGNGNGLVLLKNTLVLDLTFQEMWALLRAGFTHFKPVSFYL